MITKWIINYRFHDFIIIWQHIRLRLFKFTNIINIVMEQVLIVLFDYRDLIRCMQKNNLTNGKCLKNRFKNIFCIFMVIFCMEIIKSCKYIKKYKMMKNIINIAIQILLTPKK